MIPFQSQIKQQESKVASSKVDARHTAKLEQNFKNAEEKLNKAKYDAGEVRLFYLY